MKGKREELPAWLFNSCEVVRVVRLDLDDYFPGTRLVWLALVYPGEVPLAILENSAGSHYALLSRAEFDRLLALAG